MNYTHKISNWMNTVLRLLYKARTVVTIIVFDKAPKLWLYYCRSQRSEHQANSQHVYHHDPERIVLHSDGWVVHTHDPGHSFISWELAVRYESVCHKAIFHYYRLCDIPTNTEATEHIARITELLDEAECLSRIEQAMRPMITKDANADTIRLLAEHPKAATQPSKHSHLRPLAGKHLDDILPELQDILAMQKRQESFHPRVFKSLTSIDKRVPGPGIHTVIQTDHQRYVYPFDENYEAVLRPLRYIPSELRYGYFDPLRSRYVISNVGGYLEGCIKISLQGKKVFAEASSNNRLALSFKKDTSKNCLTRSKSPT